MVDIKVVKNDSCRIAESLVTAYTLWPPKKFRAKYNLIGLDPGQRNMGLAFWHRRSDQMQAWQIHLPESSTMIGRYAVVYKLVTGIILDCINPWNGGTCMAIVEYAAHGMRFGQVPLAEARLAAGLALRDTGIPDGQIYTPAPTSVYKAVFGSGKIKSKDVWKGVLGPDAASAVGCLLAYGGLYEKR